MISHIDLDEKLTALRKADPFRRWYSLDDRRVCVQCDRPVTGRMIEVRRDDHGSYHFRCPTPGCPGTLRDWFYQGASQRGPIRVIQSNAPIVGYGLTA